MKYSKKIFALLLERAKGERSWRNFAADCDISYVQMRKLAFCLQENPPRRKLLEKLGNGSVGGITTEDFLCAAGIGDERALNEKERALLADYNALTVGQRHSVDSYVVFLLSQKENEL